MVAHSFVPLPAEVVAIANGIIFGPLLGAVLTWVGAMLGAWAAFGVARLFGRPVVEHILSERERRALDEWTAVRGAASLVIARLIPLVAFNLVNYAAGLASISWWTFTWTTGLGILPATVLMVALGARLAIFPWWGWLAVVAGVVIAWLSVRLARKLLRRHLTPR